MLLFIISSASQLRPTLCDHTDCSTPGFSVHHQLPELLKLTTIKSVMPSNHLILCRPLLLLYYAAKLLQLCPTLCDPIDSSPPGSRVPGILQARTLEWVAISFSNAGKWKVKVKSFSRVQLLATPWTAAYQAPPSIGLSRQEYWSGVPLPSLFFIINEHKYIFVEYSQIKLKVMILTWPQVLWNVWQERICVVGLAWPRIQGQIWNSMTTSWSYRSPGRCSHKENVAG